MRRVRYSVAASLDGYIASTDGGYDWIIMDPEIDFEEIFAQFDTLLMGRKTFEAMAGGAGAQSRHMQTYVFSRTLDPAAHPGVTVADSAEGLVGDLRRMPGKDIWLFGGGELFRSLLEVGLVDAVEIAVIPVLLGGGTPMLPVPAPRADLRLTGQRVYGTGIVSLEYVVESSHPS